MKPDNIFYSCNQYNKNIINIIFGDIGSIIRIDPHSPILRVTFPLPTCIPRQYHHKVNKLTSIWGILMTFLMLVSACSYSDIKYRHIPAGNVYGKIHGLLSNAPTHIANRILTFITPTSIIDNSYLSLMPQSYRQLWQMFFTPPQLARELRRIIVTPPPSN
jgi:hypothetical protein